MVIENKLRELLQLKDRIQIYRKSLLEEADRKGYSVDERCLVATFNPEDALIEQVKDDLPSLYTTYHDTVQKHSDCREELSGLLQRYDSLTA